VTRITQIPAVLSHYLKHGVAAHSAPLGSNEGIMDRDLFWMRDETGASQGSPTSAPVRRRSRPLTRIQEITMLGVAFAFGAALQVAYVLHLAPMP
jgi:hypothetical protein